MLSKKFLTEYKKLNQEQKEAVEAIEGPVMVLAGPGTGKTQILAMRIANILAKTQINPSNILALTFTNSAVKEAKERLLEIIGPNAYQVQIYTFHAFCNEVISNFPEKFLLAKTINQLDELEQVFLVQKILKNNQFKFIKPLKSPYYYQKTIIDSIGELKQENISHEDFIAILKNEEKIFRQEDELSKAKKEELRKQLDKNKELAKIYALYQKTLAREGKYDYQDMILLVLGAFRKDGELLSHYQERFQYILVDEYQDTNTAQNEITKILASFHDSPNIFVVGDDEQSIFRFQGASMENILAFKKDYPSAKIIVLQNNYRSGQEILDASRSVIEQNKNQIYNRLKISKKLSSRQKFLSEIKLGEFSRGESENFFIAKEIQTLIKTKKISPSEIAVLFRQNRDAEELIEFLSKLDIPYQLEVGENVLDDPELHKLINFFMVLRASDAKENVPLLEVMHYPFFNLSILDIYKIVTAAGRKKKNIFEILCEPLKDLKLENEKAMRNFLELISECRKIVHANSFTHAFELIIDQTGYLQYLLSLKDDIRHLNRLQTLFKYIQALNTKHKDLNLEKFLERLALLEENNLPLKEEGICAEFEGVNLMTAHKAKGREFEVVFIIHLTDGHWGGNSRRTLIKLPAALLTSKKVVDENDEEERRLFYVSMTRAKRILYLTYAQNYGELESENLAVRSKFITELPPKFLKKIDSAPIEKKFDERLRLKFAHRKWEESRALNDFLKAILADFRLNPTALNSFLECPQRFFYDNILRVPKAKTFDQSFGTAVHSALEQFFKKYIIEAKLPPLSKLLDAFKDALNNEILPESDFFRAQKQGSEVLSKYYSAQRGVWQKKGMPIAAELNFNLHDVHFENIPITGRVDKVELMDSISKKVRIIDYKTSAPKSLNFILGKTKEQNTDLLYQAFFYKLLTECDPLFNWQVGEIVFDFISQSGFKQVAVPIEKNDYGDFKKLVKDAYQKIIKLDFPKEMRSCQKMNRTCSYLNICQDELE